MSDQPSAIIATSTTAEPARSQDLPSQVKASLGNKPGKVGWVSLGCPKALVDSENMLTRLKSEGYEIVPDYQGADLVVVNTCGFIDSAVQESFDAIGEAMKENGKVIVTGCMGVKEQEIRAQYPDVLSVSGPHQYDTVVNAVHEYVPPQHDPFVDLIPPQGVKLTPKHYAYVKISEGCNQSCTFCIIPSMRGKLVSRPMAEILAEAKKLVDNGVKELLIVSQDTGAYGVDVKYAPVEWEGKTYQSRIKDLCEALGEMGAWVRLHYVYPYPHIDDLIPLMAAGKILPYLDIPFQHASPRILKLMKRPGAVDNLLARIKKWREICPELTIRSTFIVGFPGETEEDFETLLAFLEEAQLDRVGCFAYSPVEGAAANALADPVPEAVKEDRLARFMAVQEQISAQRLQDRVGQRMQVIVDEVTEEGSVARTPGDAPDIDGLVFIDNVTEVSPGDWLEVIIEEADEHDMWAHLAD